MNIEGVFHTGPGPFLLWPCGACFYERSERGVRKRKTVHDLFNKGADLGFYRFLRQKSIQFSVIIIPGQDIVV